MSKTTVERYLSVFEELSRHPLGLTRDELRQAIPDYRATYQDSSFVRKFERDKAALRQIGFLEESAVSYDGGLTFRYRLRKGTAAGNLKALWVEKSSATTLAWAASTWADGALAEVMGRILVKLGWSAASGGSLEHRFLDGEGLLQVLQALAENRQLDFVYEDFATGLLKSRQIQVLGLGQRFGRWYVVAQELMGQTRVKKFRLDRMNRLALGRLLDFPAPVIDLEQELASLTRVEPHQVEVLTSAGERQLWASYSLDETVSQAISRGCAIAEADDSSSSYQLRARLRYLAVLSLLQEEHAATFELPALKWQENLGVRHRTNSEEGTLELLTSAYFAATHPGITLKELAREFGLGQAAMRRRLETLYVTLGEDNFFFDIDDSGQVEISLSAELKQAAELTPLELALLLFSALNVQAFSAEQGQLDLAISHLVLTCQPLLPLLARFSLHEADSLQALLRDAIADSSDLEFDYLAGQEETRRLVSPQEILVENNQPYLFAWCHVRKDFRFFRLDRVRNLKLLDSGDRGIKEGQRQQTPGAWQKQIGGFEAVLAVRHQEIDSLDFRLLKAQAFATAVAGDFTFLKVMASSEKWLLDTVVRNCGRALLVEPASVRSGAAQKFEDLLELSFH